MSENFIGMLNRNFGMSYGDDEISRNSTGKMASVSIHDLEGKEADEEMNGNIWNHEGVNLGEKFGAEMLDFDTPWDWIQDRINRGDWTGINVGDWIQDEIDGEPYRFAILGINTYKGSVPYSQDAYTVKNHIDFISLAPYDEAVSMNETNIVTSQANVPYWPTTALYTYLNNTLFGKLSAKLRALIKEKHAYMPTRSSTSATTDNGADWGNCGKLWIPSTVEICGMVVTSNVRYNNCFDIQYPFFISNMRRILNKEGQSFLRTSLAGSATSYETITNSGVLSTATASTACKPIFGFRLMEV